MGVAVERLTSLVDSPQRFAIPFADLRQAQIEAMNERFQERKDRIRLLGHRAKEAGVTETRSREEMVPLLFPHTAYKSYPESCLTEKKWDRLGKWLGTVSSHPIASIETSGIEDIDQWISRLEAKGYYISCSSGGLKRALLPPDYQQFVHETFNIPPTSIYPEETKVKLRDRLANAGAQRVVRLGSASKHVGGSPHDAMFPLQRLVHWISQENA